MHPIACTNTHCDVTDLVNHGMVSRGQSWDVVVNRGQSWDGQT